MKKYVLIPVLLLIVYKSYGQLLTSPDIMYSAVVPASVNAKAPNVASLGKYGDLNVNPNTGQPGINIPLYDIKLNNLNVPLTLSYNAAGIKIDQYPSWVGLGWTLLAGGFISRSVRGVPDDYMYPDNDHYEDTDIGHLFSKSKLDLPGNLWYDYNVLAAYGIKFAPGGGWNPEYLADGEPDDYNFSFGGYSGTFFMNEKGEWKVKSKDKIALEIIHEVNTDPVIYVEAEGPIMMKILKLATKFKIITPDGIKYTFGGDLNALDFSRASVDNFNMFWENHKYYNISPSAWYLTEVENTVGDKITFSYERGLNLIRHSHGIHDYKHVTSGTETGSNRESIVASIITPCYLTKITTPYQELEFKRSYTNEMVYEDIELPKYDESGTSVLYWYDLAQFENQMPKNTVFTESEFGNNFRGWPDFLTPPYKTGVNTRPMPGVTSNQRTPNYQFKLDTIKIYDKNKGTYNLNINLKYTNSTSLRLFLDSVVTTMADGLPQRYSFEYQSRDLVPNYNVFTKDQWGYNNGINYTGVAAPAKFSPDEWRLPSEELTKNGTIKKVIYPTGGSSEFVFELNDYSKFQKVTLSDDLGANGLVSIENVANTKAGGLRIKKIINQAGYGAPSVEREFFYTKNYIDGGSNSSGILSGKNKYYTKTIYADKCTGDIGSSEVWSDNEFFPWGEDRGNLVLYSEVTEKNASGYSVYKYSNYDSPGGMDEYHLTPFMLGLTYSDIYKLTSNDLERGLLLSEEYYTTSKMKVKETLYEYLYSTTRKDSFAKCLYKSDAFEMQTNSSMYWWIPYCVKMDFYRTYPYKKYFYNIPLKTVTETTYESGSAIANTKSFEYDAYGNVIQTTAYNSAGDKIITDTRYNSNPDYLGTATGATAIAVKKLLTDYKIKNYPVEQTTLLQPAEPLEGRFTDGSLYIYDGNKPVVAKVYKMELDAPFAKYTVSGGTGTLNYLPSMIVSGSLSFNNKYKLQESITAFSAINGNPLTVEKTASSEAYTWDNLNRHISSVTTGADNAGVAYCNFEGSYATGADENKGNWDFTPADIMISLTAPMGSKAYNLKASTGTGALNNLQTKNTLISGKKYILSFWIPEPLISTKFPQVYNGTSLLAGVVNKKSANGWMYCELLVTGAGQKLKIVLPTPSAGTVSNTIDEVRLYPEGAAMQSYTRDPVTGNVTNMCDGHNEILHYEYDGLGRLLYTKDEQGKILNQNTYRYQGAE